MTIIFIHTYYGDLVGCHEKKEGREIKKKRRKEDKKTTRQENKNLEM